MTDTPIERVARAMQEACEGKQGDFEKRPHESYVMCARAAIAALEEPSEGMIAARFKVLGQGGKAEWEAMIRAALTE